MGVIAYAPWSVTVATTIAGLGIGIVQQRFIPSLRAQGEHDEAEGLIGAPRVYRCSPRSWEVCYCLLAVVVRQ